MNTMFPRVLSESGESEPTDLDSPVESFVSFHPEKTMIESSHITESPRSKEFCGLFASFRDEHRHERWKRTERNGKIYRTYPSSTRLVHSLLDLTQSLHLYIPQYRYPTVSVPTPDQLDSNDDLIAGFDSQHNVVVLPDSALLGTFRSRSSLGDKLGEEVFGHFIRWHFLTRNGVALQNSTGGHMEDGAVEEFYGYVGRKLLLLLLQREDSDRLFFPSSSVCPPASEVRVQGELEHLRTDLRRAFFGKEDIQQKIDVVEAHREGYRWGARFDIARVKDEEWKRFFGLPAESVTQNFFRDSMAYEILHQK